MGNAGKKLRCLSGVPEMDVLDLWIIPPLGQETQGHGVHGEISPGLVSVGLTSS